MATATSTERRRPEDDVGLARQPRQREIRATSSVRAQGRASPSRATRNGPEACR